MTHVFIVDQNTFKYHLEYMFAGTGAGTSTGKNETIFLQDSTVGPYHAIERKLAAMICDISRVKKSDKIIFYVQGLGKFYGVFEAASSPFYDTEADNYLDAELKKTLTFRVKIKPHQVYAEGITEHECLDSLQGITHPYEMCWSLIYRKLKGNRGCTMITDYEFEKLLFKLKAKNRSTPLSGTGFTYNHSSKKIEPSSITNSYTGDELSLDIKKRMLYKANRKNAFEVHLQAYILQNLTKEPLKELLCFNQNNVWVGNEVACGVGMQRIDIMTIYQDEKNVYIKIVELKCIKPHSSLIDEQISWYVQWVCDYIAPNFNKNKAVHIIPTVLAQKEDSISSTDFYTKAKAFSYPRSIPNVIIEPVEYIGFTISGSDIDFEPIF